MCIECCKEFGGWCKSFTKSELLLSILQALLLIVFFICLTFLILHLHVCLMFKKKDVLNGIATPNLPYKYDTSPQVADIGQNTQYEDGSGSSTQSQNDPGQGTQYTQSTITPESQKKLKTTQQCSWTPSHKTKAVTLYYDTDAQHFVKNTIELNTEKNIKAIEKISKDLIDTDFNGDVLSLEEFDSVEADNVTKDFILALVKIIHPKDIMFGCTLTIISEYWTLTAASCVEAIEEVDALDSFVMLEGLGEEKLGKIHTVSDILIHPQYQGTNSSCDLIALKSEDSLMWKGQVILTVATMVDYLLIPIGERLTILGYGNYRSFDQETWSRRAHAVSVFSLPWQQCAPGRPEEGTDDVWAPRHLAGGRPAAAGACEAGRVAGCAGGLRARGAACGFCGGAPVMRARVLVGVVGARGCGAGCAPAAFAPLAPHARWLHALVLAQ